MPPVAVFDTNVLISAIGWAGTPRRCVELARDGLCSGVTSEPLLEELAAVLERKLGFSQEQLLETCEYFLTFLQLAHVGGGVTGVCSDPKDDIVLESALAGNATHVVTGDRRHLLPLREFRGIKIVGPAEFLLAFDRRDTGPP